jgi:hypothetical protein
MVHARGNIPVDIAHIIAVLVFAHLTKRHTPSLKRGVVLSGKELLRQSLRLDFDQSNLPE